MHSMWMTYYSSHTKKIQQFHFLRQFIFKNQSPLCSSMWAELYLSTEPRWKAAAKSWQDHNRVRSGFCKHVLVTLTIHVLCQKSITVFARSGPVLLKQKCIPIRLSNPVYLFIFCVSTLDVTEYQLSWEDVNLNTEKKIRESWTEIPNHWPQVRKN